VDGPDVITSDRLPRLGEFTDFRHFRDLLKQERNLVHKNLARRLATFALGRSMGFADEADLQQIVDATTEDGGGMKTMVRELVASEIFKKR